jgi:hypothetical protein
MLDPDPTYLYPPVPTYLPTLRNLPTYLLYLHTYRGTCIPTSTYVYLPTYWYLPTYLPIRSVSPRADLFSSTLSCNKKEEKNHQTSQLGNLGAPLVNQVSNMGAPLVNQVSNMGAPPVNQVSNKGAPFQKGRAP